MSRFLTLLTLLFSLMLLSGCGASSDDSSSIAGSGGSSGGGSGGDGSGSSGGDGGGSGGDGGGSGGDGGGSGQQQQIIRLNSQMHTNVDDNVLIYVDSNLDKNARLIYDTDRIKAITNDIYSHFKDDFDFIFLITNNSERPQQVTYAGVFSKISNDVEGIGASLYSHADQYGSAGRLKGIMHFSYRSAILSGPTLHEILHNWANKFRSNSYPYQVGRGSHWGYTGFFGGKGQLGGYDANTFRDEQTIDKLTANDSDPKNLFSAEQYGWNANGGNGLPYNDLELYLMGMIGKNEVQDLLIAIPSASPRNQSELPDGFAYDSGRKYIAAQSIERKTLVRFLNDLNERDRNPDYLSSQKEFRILTVLLDSSEPQAFETGIISGQLGKFTRPGDDGNSRNYNFWEATGGRGKLHAGNLADHLKTSGTPETVDHSYQPVTLSHNGLDYQTVQSPYTGKIWLDRNIGASQPCTSATDRACFGGYYQWGRGNDGHQQADSPYTETKMAAIDGSDDRFVVTRNSSSGDWLGPGIDDDRQLRLARWTATDGSGICPSGFRLPTRDELRQETSGNPLWDPFASKEDAFSHFLKLPAAGYRNDEITDAKLSYENSHSMLWTSDVTANGSVTFLLVGEGTAIIAVTDKLAHGASVRCIGG